MPPLTREQARNVDRLAIEAGIPGIVLMENAAINTTAVILDQLDSCCAIQPDEARVFVLCGGGNNGGDGYAIARHLHNWASTVTVFACTDPASLTGDALVNYIVCRNLGFDIRPVLDETQLAAESEAWNTAHVVVDALLGTGFKGELRPHMLQVIRKVNELDRPFIVSVDVPSGLDCETGSAGLATVRADVTVTFVEAKTGFTGDEAEEFLGRVIVADIGVPPQVIQRALLD